MQTNTELNALTERIILNFNSFRQDTDHRLSTVCMNNQHSYT